MKKIAFLITISLSLSAISQEPQPYIKPKGQALKSNTAHYGTVAEVASPVQEQNSNIKIIVLMLIAGGLAGSGLTYYLVKHKRNL